MTNAFRSRGWVFPAIVVGMLSGTPTVGDVPERQATAVFAGGCFWGIEAVFDHVKGVVEATSGYGGGSLAKPSYEQVSTGDTGHAESVRVVYDPAEVSYEQLLRVFFLIAHDPTELNRQGPDVGTQYRSAIFYGDTVQKRMAERYVAQLAQRRAYKKPIVTQILPLRAFYEAEEYHQNYLEHHPDEPYILMYDAPKLVALRSAMPELYR